MPSLRGEFQDETGKPIVKGRVLLPRLNASIDVNFLVDTGADFTVLGARDARIVGFTRDLMTNRVRMGGSAGQADHHLESATVSFLSGRTRYSYRLALIVMDPVPELAHVSSLLGRDILNRWDMSYRPSRGKLTFDIVTADETLRIN